MIDAGKEQKKPFKKTRLGALKKIVLVLGVIFFGTVIINAGMFFIGIKTNHLHRWGEGQYFGKIVELNDNRFVIQGRGRERKMILITEKTVLKKGSKDFRDALQIGDSVLVFGPVNENGEVVSRLVRVFDPNAARDSRNLPFLP